MFKQLKNNKGMALMMALFFTVIFYGLTASFMLTVLNETRMARIDRGTAKAFYTAQAAGQTALNQLNILINNYLLNTITNSNPNGVVSFATSQVSSGDGIGWLVYAVRDPDPNSPTYNEPVLTVNGEQAEYSSTGTIGRLGYQYLITLTEQFDPVQVSTDVWDFPYNYIIQASNTTGDNISDVTIYGNFTVRLQQDNFAKYALFTNSQKTPSGSKVWFTDKTNFAGPVHTNGRFNFAFNPSGIFEEAVVQQEALTRFYNHGWTVLLDDDHNGNNDVPIFNDTFTRNASAINLSSGTQEQDMVDQATGGQPFISSGIYLPNSNNTLTGGIYIKGDSDITMSVDANDLPVYTITQGGTVKTITVDQTNQQTIVDDGSGITQTYSGVPDGVDDVGTLIYVDGSIDNFGGTVQSNSKITVASKNDIVISNNVMYESYTSAVGSPGDAGYVPPNADGANNLLGIVTWQGDVQIGTTAPDNIQIHGTILASNGIFQVNNYNDMGSGPRGTATLLGGAITDNYGAFGLFSGATGQQLSGYGRNFVYDQRLKVGEAPPYFPSLNTFIAFTNDITDKMIWKEGQ